MIKHLYGTIIDVNAQEYVCDIEAIDPDTNNAHTLKSVPFLSTSLSADVWSGVIAIPERLSKCIVISINDQYYLMDVIPDKQHIINGIPDIDDQISITQTKKKYAPEFQNTREKQSDVNLRETQASARVSLPHDVLPGDKFWRTRGGAFLGALRGGVIIARVSEFCQFVLNRIDGMARLVSRNLQVFTDWGRLDILNNKTATNLSLHVGENYVNNKAGKFTIHLDVGAVGDLVNLRVTDVEGTELARTQIFPNGRIEAESVHSIYIKRGGSVVDLNNSGVVFIKSEGQLFIN